MNVRPVLATLPLILALAACGGAPAKQDGVASAASGSATATASTAATATGGASAPADPREAQLKFAQCMREHGVPMDDPEPNGAIRIKMKKGMEQQVEEAQQACKHFMDAAIGDRMGRPDQKTQDRALKFAQCMREHGIHMEDPSSDGKFKIDIPAGTPEEKLNAAHEACKEFDLGGGPR
ncbi:hypothetical protein [Nonomuraea cavernae]|uniref:Uncharacterized protein n=1 Tax=Nonomuraea cavernae TaxID=2045107 RepID=A0A917YSY5_9ACTN|nr:hypothetical protein [Nonomuraea cavernae]MCA2184522.1 hypothetical protein [Nonomuraea cavernae]GGO63534.1 hypothetical protein GCM10012289_10820 [Nonomuraea cavernae]